MRALYQSANVCALVGLLALGGCAVHQQGAQPATVQPASTLRAEIEKATAELLRRFGTHDMASVAQVYADDAVILGPNGYRVQGREAIDRYWAPLADAKSWKLDTVSVEGAKDLAVHRGRSTLVHKDRTGNDATSVVEFSVVWRRQADGAWRILVDAYWH